ncbi:MAG: GNAT family N-acetyltransferase [Bacteroidota bacterium]
MSIRPFVKEDIQPLRDILRATDVFKEEEIVVAVELMEIAAGEPDQQEYIMATSVDEANVVRGYYCIGPTPMTCSTFDLYWIAVDPAMHGKGIGRELNRHCEEYIVSRGGTLIVAETSSQPKYEKTRAFYLRNHYIEASRIRDYYSPGDDLVVYTKHL